MCNTVLVLNVFNGIDFSWIHSLLRLWCVCTCVHICLCTCVFLLSMFFLLRCFSAPAPPLQFIGSDSPLVVTRELSLHDVQRFLQLWHSVCNCIFYRLVCTCEIEAIRACGGIIPVSRPEGSNGEPGLELHMKGQAYVGKGGTREWLRVCLLWWVVANIC